MCLYQINLKKYLAFKSKAVETEKKEHSVNYLHCLKIRHALNNFLHDCTLFVFMPWSVQICTLLFTYYTYGLHSLYLLPEIYMYTPYCILIIPMPWSVQFLQNFILSLPKPLYTVCTYVLQTFLKWFVSCGRGTKQVCNKLIKSMNYTDSKKIEKNPA